MKDQEYFSMFSEKINFCLLFGSSFWKSFQDNLIIYGVLHHIMGSKLTIENLQIISMPAPSSLLNGEHLATNPGNQVRQAGSSGSPPLGAVQGSPGSPSLGGLQGNPPLGGVQGKPPHLGGVQGSRVNPSLTRHHPFTSLQANWSVGSLLSSYLFILLVLKGLFIFGSHNHISI